MELLSLHAGCLCGCIVQVWSFKGRLSYVVCVCVFFGKHEEDLTEDSKASNRLISEDLCFQLCSVAKRDVLPHFKRAERSKDIKAGVGDSFTVEDAFQMEQ